MKLSIAFLNLSCASAVLFARAVPTTSHLPTTNGLPLTPAFSHARSVSSAHLVPTQEGRRQMKEDCLFADGTPGTKVMVLMLVVVLTQPELSAVAAMML